MQTIIELLFSISLSLFIFSILYYLIKKYIKKKENISKRIRGLWSSEDREQYKIEDSAARRNDKKSLASIPFVERVIIPFKLWLERTAMKIAPREIQAVIQKRLMIAGKYPQWSVAGFVVIVVAMAALGAFLGLDLSQKKGMIFIQQMVASAIGAAVGGLVPFSILNIMIQKRQKLILKQMPEVLDLLCVSVQAGLSFDGAMRKIVDRMKGPLIDECRRMLDDVRMGMVRRQALRMMAERCDVQDIALFTTAVIQSERLGTSMATTLNNQAENMRERRRQYIKAEALKAPVKIVFPLIMFIFPVLFVVTLLPAILSISDSQIMGK